MKLTLGEECLILRRRAGIHLLDAAKKLKTSHTTLSRIEMGHKYADMDKAREYKVFLKSGHIKLSDER